MSQQNVPDVGFLDAFGQRFGPAWNSHEPDRLLELMTDDVVYDDSAWPRTMRDHSQVREFLEFLWRALPDLEFEDLEGPFLAREARTAVYYWRGTGTFTRPLNPPGFRPPAPQSRSRASSSSSSGATVCRLRIVYDLMDLDRQMGVEGRGLRAPGCGIGDVAGERQRTGSASSKSNQRPIFAHHSAPLHRRQVADLRVDAWHASPTCRDYVRARR